MNRAERRFAKHMMKHAGMSTLPKSVNFNANEPWHVDDRKWFENHPGRSHRLRKLFSGECAEKYLCYLPPRHEHQVIVRQIEPGMRIRMPFGRNLDIELPDIEPLLHALFDLAKDSGAAISVRETAMLALKYARAGAAQ